MGDISALDDGKKATENARPEEEAATVNSTILTLSISEEEERRVPADFFVLCRANTGQVTRFKTHKQALIHSSIFFRDLFAGCTPSDGDEGCPSDEVHEIEMTESHSVVFVFLLSLYIKGNALRSTLEQNCSESAEQYSR